MFGFWKKKKKESELISAQDRELTGIMLTLDVFEEKGLLAWNPEERRLFVDERIALFYMSSEQAWRNFLGHVFNWAYFRECNDAWESHTQRLELHAVSDARKAKGSKLSYKEVCYAKQGARDKMKLGDVKPPQVKPFEFLLCSAPGEDNKPVIEVIGTFHPDSGFQMTEWNTVKEILDN